MKAGVRALGIAESYQHDRSTVCGAVTTADGVADGFVFTECTVGGLDATDAVVTCVELLDRADVQFVLVGGVAWAWYNILDVERLRDAVDVPIFLLTFEASDGMDAALEAAFDGDALAERRRRYERLPARIPVVLPDGRIFVRVLGSTDDDPETVVRAFTRSGVRPEPVRIARLAARAADRWARESEAI